MNTSPEKPMSVHRLSAVCPVCGRRVHIGIPSMGDGSADVYFRHKDKFGLPCIGSRRVVEEPTEQTLFGPVPAGPPVKKKRPFEYKPEFGLVITFDSEAEQERAFNRLSAQGYKCRVVTV